MTPEDQALVEQSERLAAAATPGPWNLLHKRHRDMTITSVYGAKVAPGEREVVHWSGFDDSAYPVREHVANAAFIADARTAVPALASGWRREAAIVEELAAVVRAADGFKSIGCWRCGTWDRVGAYEPSCGEASRDPCTPCLMKAALAALSPAARSAVEGRAGK